MKYKVGDKVRIKNIDWYNENKDEFGDIDISEDFTFYADRSKYCGKVFTISEVFDNSYLVKEDNNEYYWSDEMIEGLVERNGKTYPYKIGDRVILKGSNRCATITDLKYNCQGNLSYYIKIDNDKDISIDYPTELLLPIECKVKEETKPKDIGEVSDGYHTFNELYEYRMLYNAALFNEFAKQGLYDVHKSRRHSDGEYPFGDSNWFIVMAELPTGQISNHYEMKDWDKFQIPEKPLANKWDEHSPRDVADRLTSFTNPKKEYPKTYKECCNVLDIEDRELVFNGEYRASKLYWKQLGRLNTLNKLLICLDAYWKIAGEEIGLGKSWEPDWNNPHTTKWTIVTGEKVRIVRGNTRSYHSTFAFPTEEMRDAFYEAFKELIEECKDLL